MAEEISGRPRTALIFLSVLACRYGGFLSACSPPFPSLPPHPASSQTQTFEEERDLGAARSAPGEAKAPPACSSGVIFGSALWILLHGLVAPLVGAITAIGTLLLFPSFDMQVSGSAPLLFVHSLLASMAGVSTTLGTLLPSPSLWKDKPTAIDVLLPGEHRRYLKNLSKRKWEKRQKRDKKVNKPGLFMLFLVVSSQVLAISEGATLAQSAGVTESRGSGSVAGAGGTERKALEGVTSIVVSGMCADKSLYNGIYEPMAFTKSARPWYRNENGAALYWDPDCYTGAPDWWIFDNNEPSVTAESDLDGEWREVVEERK